MATFQSTLTKPWSHVQPPKVAEENKEPWQKARPDTPRTPNITSSSQAVSSYEDLPEVVELKADPFICSPFVVGLNRCYFKEFIRERDVTLVMFYDRNTWQNTWSKKHFIRAAKTTERPNHAYAAVDCTIEPDLCCHQGATTLPYFKLFSAGRSVNKVDDAASFKAVNMRRFVETAPFEGPARRPTKFSTPTAPISST